ncbi:MAG: outer membrane beta-barrel protein [Gammaproteobacteria bacterium]|nr:outer membrane beta-barrel protein [Gammaproteobacteria bacterium]
MTIKYYRVEGRRFADRLHALIFLTLLLALGTPCRGLELDSGNGVRGTWEGWFLGASVGYRAGHSSSRYLQEDTSGAVFGFEPSTQSSALRIDDDLHAPSGSGGLRGGYNRLVGTYGWGVVTDFDYVNVDQDKTHGPVVAASADTVPQFLSVSAEQEWFGSTRAQIELFPRDCWMLYLTGGVAYGGVRRAVSQTMFVNIGPREDLQRSFSSREVKVGWAAGAGTEYRVARSLSVGAEYLYVDLGEDELSVSGSPGTPNKGFGDLFPPATATFSDRFSILRLTVNFRFGAGGR